MEKAAVVGVEMGALDGIDGYISCVVCNKRIAANDTIRTPTEGDVDVC